MDIKKVLKKNSQVVAREIEGEVILIPLYSSSEDLNSIYTLNKTAALAWELINGKRTLGEIREKLLKEYDVNAEKLTKQLDGLIKDLKSIKAIV